MKLMTVGELRRLLAAEDEQKIVRIEIPRELPGSPARPQANEVFGLRAEADCVWLCLGPQYAEGIYSAGGFPTLIEGDDP